MSGLRFESPNYQFNSFIEDEKRRLTDAVRITLEKHTEQQLIEWLVALPEPHRSRVLTTALALAGAK